jgi:hypothetical protein
VNEDLTHEGQRVGQQARHSTLMRGGARVGLVSFGVVHLLIAWIAIRVAWFGSGDASSGGALRELADKPLGGTLLWIAAAGLVMLAVWQLMTAAWGFQSETDGKKRTYKRLSAVGRAIVYSVLALSAARVASGSGSSGDSKEEGLTADLMSAPAGRILVAAVGVGILVVAARHIHRGLSDTFTHDLEAPATSGSTGTAVLVAGRVGYVAKGVAIGVVGVLFGWAAISYDPDKAGGLDDALSTLREQPYGPYLLTLVAAGLAAFGLFCFAWARYVRTR